MKNLKQLSLILSSLFIGLTASADKMNSETQNAVIDRLERVLSQMESSDGAWSASNLRLADLLAERARLRFMNEIEANCKGCKGSEADRKKAISIYEGIQNKAGKLNQSVIYFQLAHLYNMNNQSTKAIELFNKITKTSKEAELVSRSHEGLGDIYFQSGKSKLAQEHYTKALNNKDTANRGLLTYRIAWCEFSQDQLKKATQTLEKLLSQPEMLTKETEKGPVYDGALHEDVMRDLATFYARSQVGDREIKSFITYSPQDLRKELLLFFASEADRVGQKKAARQIYQAYMKEDLSKEERLDALMRTAQVQYDSGLQSTGDFALAAKAFQETGCKTEEKCAEIQKRMKRYVTELHRSKKTAPNADVLSAYVTYINIFSDDAEMATLGAQVAMDLKKYSEAGALYHSAAVSSHRQMKAKDFAKLSAKEQKKTAQVRNIGLNGEIEAAELAKDSDAREKAYINYLALSPEGDKQFAIRYQLAQLAYERKQWSQAANEFNTLALDKSGPEDLRKKSADLALDSLALEKRDKEIEKVAASYALAFPAHRDEFMKLSRKAVINQVASTTNDNSSSTSELRAALIKLRSSNLNGASDVEKILHHKNEAVIAQKIGDSTALLASLNALLAVKSLSAQDREDTLARKVGVYEMQLDFKNAYATAKLMKFAKSSQAEKELKLGTLAELAGLNPVNHYNNYLKLNPKGVQSPFIRTRLVMLSSNPLKELKKHSADLMRQPILMSQVLLSIYGRTKDLKSIEGYLKSPAIAKTAAAKMILKQPFYEAQIKFAVQINKHKINSKTQSSLQKTLKERAKLLAQADDNLKKSVRMNDYTAQIVSLTTVSQENYRLVSDIMSLPVPKKLTPELKNQYMALIKQQAQPYMSKAQVADAKLQEFWHNSEARDSLVAQYKEAQKEVKSVYRTEIIILASRAPESIRNELKSALRDNGSDIKELTQARAAARENPTSERLLQNLKALETKIGNPVMATYLDARLNRNQGTLGSETL